MLIIALFLTLFMYILIKDDKQKENFKANTESFTQKHPYATIILLGLLCTFMTGLGSAVSHMVRLDADVQIVVITVFLVISIAIGILCFH